ncbi:MAG: ABC transporter permease subunit [Thaumarchaeota archaeon]|nr:ABC transporter permease subunit [Nitrososphaerota archaeon]
MELGIIALATLASLGRVLALILVSIVSGWFLSYFAIKSRKFENIYISFVNIFESIPVIGFLPIVLVVFISGLGGMFGVEVAADFLVFDAIVWNIWIGQYQAFKTVPQPLIEVSENYNFGWRGKMKSLYIPFSYPRVSSDIFPSFADALFYIMISEVFSVGITSYKVFGIGTLIVQATSTGDLNSMYECLGVLAIGVVVITLLFSNFSKHVIAKYGLNTSTEIKRNVRYWRPHIRKWRAVGSPAFQFARYTTKMKTGRENIQLAMTKVRTSRSFERTGKYIGTGIAWLFLIFIGYSSIQVMLSVPHSQWINYFTQTPNLLYQMGIDYIRVLVITIVSFVFAVSLGYYLAVHRRVSMASLPIIQTISAFPAPAYFPLVFAATASFLAQTIPFAETEIFVMILCFLGTFYYVFFGFWVGVRAIPVEFLELTQNYKIGFFTKMRRIIIPATFPYLVTGLSSTINSAWGGLAVAEYWPNIFGNQTLQVHTGMMKVISAGLVNGNIGLAAWTSLLFAIVVGIYSIVFTRNLMDLARKKYVIEEGIYAA